MKKILFFISIFLIGAFAQAGKEGSLFDRKFFKKSYQREKLQIIEARKHGFNSLSCSRFPLGHTKMAMYMLLMNQPGLVQSRQSLNTPNLIGSANKQKPNKNFHVKPKATHQRKIKRSPGEKSLLIVALRAGDSDVTDSKNISPVLSRKAIRQKLSTELGKLANQLPKPTEKYNKLTELYQLVCALNQSCKGQPTSVDTFLGVPNNKKKYSEGIELLLYYKNNIPTNPGEKELYTKFTGLVNKLFPQKSPSHSKNHNPVPKKVQKKKKRISWLKCFRSSHK